MCTYVGPLTRYFLNYIILIILLTYIASSSYHSHYSLLLFSHFISLNPIRLSAHLCGASQTLTIILQMCVCVCVCVYISIFVQMYSTYKTIIFKINYRVVFLLMKTKHTGRRI